MIRDTLLKLRKRSPLLQRFVPDGDGRALRLLFSDIIAAIDERPCGASGGGRLKLAVWHEGGKDYVVSRLRNFAKEHATNPTDAETLIRPTPRSKSRVNSALITIAHKLLHTIEW